MDIKKKLARLDPDETNKKENNKYKNKKYNKDMGKDYQIDSEEGTAGDLSFSILENDRISASIKKNKHGKHLVITAEYILDYQHGLYQLGKISDCCYDDHNILARKFFGYGYKKFLFIDTETTGLAGGTGTTAFMIGLGYFTDEKFVTKQLFMRDFHEEAAVLYTLKDFFDRFPVMISFNGKSFDLPLVSTRMVMNRFQKIKDKVHIDLLHEARRNWSHFDSCSLSRLEEKVLNVKRKNDVPGYRVPHLYFQFLKNDNYHQLAPVFNHNRIDIISLVTLLIKLLENHCPRIKKSQNLSSRVLFNLGQIYDGDKKTDISITFYEKALLKSDTVYLKTGIERKLSWQYKRKNNWEKATVIWEQMYNQGRGGLFPYRELAKYYEHQQKDYALAGKFTRQALDYICEKRNVINNYIEEKEKLEHRLQRLQQKQENR